MKLEDLDAIIRSLNDSDVRYLVVDGMAVVSHGYGWTTIELDLVIQLDRVNIRRAFHALKSLGYSPRVPVTAEQFADPTMREHWMVGKNKRVHSLWSEEHRETPVDLFVQEPFPFDVTFARAEEEIFEDGTRFPLVDLETLISMKRNAGREKDLTMSATWRCCEMKKSGKIAEHATDWECDWEGSKRFHLRYFRALSFTEKVRAVENMGQMAVYFRSKAKTRRRVSLDQD
jgi:predicted nucleotidyltransferase